MSMLKVSLRYYRIAVLLFVQYGSLEYDQDELSPCPEIFSYRKLSPGNWYGLVVYNSSTSTEEALFQIRLNYPANIIAVDFDNLHFETDTANYNNINGVSQDNYISHRFIISVKYLSGSFVPKLDSITFNGNLICSGSSKQITEDFNAAELQFETDNSITDAVHMAKMFTSVSLNEPNCGQIGIVSPLIHGGIHVKAGQWPWHVALYLKVDDNLKYICGGSIISKKKVITAAHCVAKVANIHQLVVYLGKSLLSPHIIEEGQQTKYVTESAIYPHYNSSNFHGDISILTLDSDVEYTRFVKPVCVWDFSAELSDIVGQLGTYAGWGLTETEKESDILKIAKIPVVSHEDCIQSFPAFYSLYMSQNSYCGGFRNGTSPCNGDSGGGLMFEYNSLWYLRGIISVSVGRDGQNICDPYHYIIFTDVAKYIDFIIYHL